MRSLYYIFLFCNFMYSTAPAQFLSVTLSAAPNDSICPGTCATITASVTGGTPPYTYYWTPSLGSGSSVFACPTSTIIYTVTVTDQLPLTATGTIKITVLPQMNLSLSKTDETCNGADGSACVNISGGISPYTYTWMPMANTNSCISNLSSGIHTVSVIDFMGCSKIDTISILPYSGLSIIMTTLPNKCGNNTGAAAASVTGGIPPYTYIWSPTGSGPTISNLSCGIYSLTVWDAVGCAYAATDTVSCSLIMFNVSENDASCSTCCNGSATAMVTGSFPPYTYSWSTNPIQTTASAIGLCPGTYTVTVSNKDGCTDTASVVISYPSALPDVNFVLREFSIYPIPSDGNSFSVSYELTQASEIQLDIYTILGVKIYSFESGDEPPGIYKKTIYLEKAATGVFLLRFFSGNLLYQRKIALIKE